MNMSANQYFPQFNAGNCENNNSEPYNNYRNMPPNISSFNPTNGYMNEFWNFQTRYSDYYGAGSDSVTRNRSFCQMLPMNREYEKINFLHSVQNDGTPLPLIQNKRSPSVRDLEDTSTPIINCPKYCESEPEKSSALRSLLTNPKRKITYSPDYYTKNSQKSESHNDSDGNAAKINITLHNNGRRNTLLSSIHQSQVPPTYDRSVHSTPYLCERDYLEYTPNGHHLFSNMPNHSYKGGYPTPPPYLASNISDVNSDKHFESSPPLSTSSPSSAIEGLVSPPLSPNNQNFAASSQNMTFPAWLQKTDAKESLEDQKGKRTRQTYSRDQTLQLEQNFNMTSYVSRAQRALLAKNLNLTERQVKIWFQNRRMKAKKDQGRGTSPSQNLQRTCPSASLAGTQLESQELIDPVGSMSVPSSFNKPVIPSQALSDIAKSLASQPYTIPPTTFGYPVSPNNVQAQPQHQTQYNNTISTTGGDYLTNQPYFPFYGPQTHAPVGGSCGQNSPGSGITSSNFGTVLCTNQAVTNVFAA